MTTPPPETVELEGSFTNSNAISALQFAVDLICKVKSGDISDDGAAFLRVADQIYTWLEEKTNG